tara:strand:+ start:308 stop:676 length:369 start_codon:yes stop_codon:yes gene_type:complete
LDLDVVIHILIGSSCGLILRLITQYKFKEFLRFNLDHSSIVNVLASLFLGVLVAFNPSSKNLLLLFFGFLGCFSTFSSFIYQLFNLIRKRKYISLLIYYIEVLVLSLLFFSLGYFISLSIKS